MKILRTRSVAIVAAVIVASTVLVIAADRDAYHALWIDANAAVSWENPLCTPVSALQGLRQARAVKLRTDQIRQQIRRVREDADGLFLYDTPGGPVWMP